MKTNLPIWLWRVVAKASLSYVTAGACLCALPFGVNAQQAPASPQNTPPARAMATAAAAATLSALMPGEVSGLPLPGDQSASAEVMIGLGTVAGYVKVDDVIVRLSRSVRIYDSMRRMIHPSQLPLLLQNNQVPARVSMDPYGNVQVIWLNR